MSELFTPRSRKVKILATLGPASSNPEMIRALLLAGADAFRINMSHGDHAQKAELVAIIRALEKAGWNVTATARTLGIPLSTLKFKMDRLEIRELARKIRGN